MPLTEGMILNQGLLKATKLLQTNDNTATEMRPKSLKKKWQMLESNPQ